MWDSKHPSVLGAQSCECIPFFIILLIPKHTTLLAPPSPCKRLAQVHSHFRHQHPQPLHLLAPSPSSSSSPLVLESRICLSSSSAMLPRCTSSYPGGASFGGAGA